MRINRLIKLRATGSPRELADKLGISERSVYDYISNMKELGAPIAFSYSHNSYIYCHDGDLIIGFSFDILTETEEKIILGGCLDLLMFPSSKRTLYKSERFNITAEILQ